MEINYLKINGFGKLEDKEIKLTSGLNLIYGKNESGKTTLLKFITSMLYGISKNKNGKDIADYDKYIPWSKGEFSGKIGYTLGNDKSYEIFRDFNKKNIQIYNEKKEDISKEYNIDKAKGNEFFYDQTHVDETLLYTTSVVEQQNVVLGEKEQSILTQKVTNLLSTGDDNISYKKSMEKLNRKLIEEVGTDRTVGRPINLINDKISDVSNELKLLESYGDKKEEIELEKKELESKIESKEIYIEVIKEIKKVKEESNLDEEKIKIKNDIKKEFSEKIDNLNNKLNASNEKKDVKNKSDKINLMVIPILIILSILINFINVNEWIDYGIILGTVIYLLVTLTLFLKNKNRNKKMNIDSKEARLGLRKELNILEENSSSIEKEIRKLQERLKNKLQESNALFKSKYSDKIDKNSIDNLFNNQSEELSNLLNNETDTRNSMKIGLNTIEIEEKDVVNKLELKSKYVEELESLNEQREELLELESAINIARSALETAYNQMKDQITPKFTKDLSAIVEHISGGKYKNVRFNDENGLRVEKENGEYIDVGLLSLGTIDQMYLSLRLSMLNEITDEKMPIILDEAFVYYDEARLNNILEYLARIHKDHQIIMLSCSDREEKALKTLGIQYNGVEI